MNASEEDRSDGAITVSMPLGEVVERTGWFSPNTPLSVARHGYATSSRPEVSFVVPVFNQGKIIGEHLESIRANARLRHEVVVVVDGCTDDTAVQVRDWALRSAGVGNTVGVTAVVVETGIFETLSDSVGASLSTGEYLIEVQADMLIQDSGFDEGMTSALRAHPELIVVGGRGAHSFSAAGLIGRRSAVNQRLARRVVTSSSKFSRSYVPTRGELHLSDSIGRGGELIDVPHGLYPGRLFVHETTMRGPWAIRRSDFTELGGFDTTRFFLGNDDHDFALRAVRDGQRRTAFLPIRFSSPLDLGSTRVPRPADAAKRFAEIRRHYDDQYSGSALAQGLPSRMNLRRYSMQHDWRTG
jgi:hypothetical protein